MPESFPLAIKPGWSCWTGCVPHPSRFVPPSLASQDFWSRAWAGRAVPAPSSTPPAVGTQESTAAVVDTDRALREMRDRGQSDDAESIDEATFHGMARAAVILNVEPNTLGVDGGEFRVKRHPVAPGGAFVYDPRDVFAGVTQNLVWWVPSGDLTALMAYPLNGPSKAGHAWVGVSRSGRSSRHT